MTTDSLPADQSVGESGPEFVIFETNPPAIVADAVMRKLQDENPRGSHVRLYFSEGEPTPDGRYVDLNSINFDRPPPYPFRIQTKQPENGGHAGAELAGVLTSYYREGEVLILTGPLDMGCPAGREAERLVREGFLQTWSPDLGNVTWDEEVLTSDDEGMPTDVLAHIVSATFLGGTATTLPSLASAVIELLDDEGNVVTPALIRGTALTACGEFSAPPSEFFTNPNLSEIERWTSITPEGRVYGHAAGPGECHIGYLDRCVTIEMIADCRGEGNFEYAMGNGHVVTAEGTKIGTGPIAIKGGHAPKSYGWKESLAHYDDPDSVVADVVYGMDDLGAVWFSGALRPTATKEMVYTLRASGVSLDAREINGELRYLATCCVNTGGFPKVSVRLAASGEEDEPRILALIAAGGPPEPFITDDCVCCDDAELEDLELRVLTTRMAHSL